MTLRAEKTTTPWTTRRQAWYTQYHAASPESDTQCYSRAARTLCCVALSVASSAGSTSSPDRLPWLSAAHTVLSEARVGMLPSCVAEQRPPCTKDHDTAPQTDLATHTKPRGLSVLPSCVVRQHARHVHAECNTRHCAHRSVAFAPPPPLPPSPSFLNHSVASSRRQPPG